MITLFLQAAYQKASQNRNSNLEQMLQPPPNCSELTCAMIGKNTSRRLKLPSNYHRKVRLPESEKFPSFERVDRSFCVKSNAITKWIWPYCDIHSVASIVGEKSWWAWTHEGEGGKLLFFSPSFLACLNLRNTELTICLESHEKCLSHHHCQAGNHGLFPVSIPSSVYHIPTHSSKHKLQGLKNCKM